MTVDELMQAMREAPGNYEVKVRTGPKVIAVPGPAVARGSASISEAEVQPGPRQVLLKTDRYLALADGKPADARPAAQDPGLC